MTPLFTWYGDDFTGSTDALEVLASAGIESVLFLAPPTPAQLAQFPHAQAIGIAGESRSQSPSWMDANLPQVFESLKAIGAPLCQYKVCSTFDSSPETGSIGRALEVGRRVFQNPWVPIAVGAPHLRRYVVFGNLFAVFSDSNNHRIDRHPTMSRHPVTPMDEGDLRRHLARQTQLPIGHLDLVALRTNPQAALSHALTQNPAAILFDGLFDDSLLETGRLIWKNRPQTPAFCLGSSGLTHALMLHWRETGLIPATHHLPTVPEADRIVAISGSCSPVTENQIRQAIQTGYAALPVDPNSSDPETLISQAAEATQNHPGVILYTALGPLNGAPPLGESLGRYLGILLRDLIRKTGIRRAAVAGGDTASHAVRQLGLDALTFAGPLAPGSPLCRASSSDPALDGLEITLKGGQVGAANFFQVVKQGRS